MYTLMQNSTKIRYCELKSVLVVQEKKILKAAELWASCKVNNGSRALSRSLNEVLISSLCSVRSYKSCISVAPLLIWIINRKIKILLKWRQSWELKHKSKWAGFLSAALSIFLNVLSPPLVNRWNQRLSFELRVDMQDMCSWNKIFWY